MYFREPPSSPFPSSCLASSSSISPPSSPLFHGSLRVDPNHSTASSASGNSETGTRRHPARACAERVLARARSPDTFHSSPPHPPSAKAGNEPREGPRCRSLGSFSEPHVSKVLLLCGDHRLSRGRVHSGTSAHSRTVNLRNQPKGGRCSRHRPWSTPCLPLVRAPVRPSRAARARAALPAPSECAGRPVPVRA